MTPEEQHHAALEALNAQAVLLVMVYGREGSTALLEGVWGRRRILERHAPDTEDGVTACTICRPATKLDGVTIPWPCPDYRDAAAGLLPEELA